jgi:hypothetical protein
MTPFPVSKVLVLIALVLFLLAAFGVSFGSVSLLALGLAFLAGAYLIA